LHFQDVAQGNVLEIRRHEESASHPVADSVSHRDEQYNDTREHRCAKNQAWLDQEADHGDRE
jgi:hypothetical protein